MYYLYFLFSQQANKFYVGYSANPWKRLQQHLSNGGEKFTGGYHDWELIAVFEVSELRGDAVKVEKFSFKIPRHLPNLIRDRQHCNLTKLFP